MTQEELDKVNGIQNEIKRLEKVVREYEKGRSEVDTFNSEQFATRPYSICVKKYGKTLLEMDIKYDYIINAINSQIGEMRWQLSRLRFRLDGLQLVGELDEDKDDKNDGKE